MSDRRAICCPGHGTSMAERLTPLLVRCMGVWWENVAPPRERPRFELRPVARPCDGLLLATCGGCGGMSLAGMGPTLRCALCRFERELRPEEIAAIGDRPVRQSIDCMIHLGVREPEQRPLAFVPPPMPVFSKGAALPAPAKPRGYQPPKEKR